MNYTQINQEHYTIYQPYMLLDFENSYKHDIPKDDLSVTIMEVLRRINLNDFIDFHNYDARSYYPVMILAIILFAFSEEGYASLRKLEKLCRYDIRYRNITNGCVPSYKSFQRFINQTLKGSIDDIGKQIYLYVQDKKALEEQILYIDGTKFEANANKMTFCWKGWSKRYLPRHWQKYMELIRQLNKYFEKHNIDIKYSILKYPSIEFQVGVNNGYIAFNYISSDANDIRTLQPFLEGYKQMYGEYPDRIVADAGYGSYENYNYCFQDFEYVRLHRRGESRVAVELSLVCIGYNLRKYHNRKVATKMNSFSTVKIKIAKQNHKK